MVYFLKMVYGDKRIKTGCALFAKKEAADAAKRSCSTVWLHDWQGNEIGKTVYDKASNSWYFKDKEA